MKRVMLMLLVTFCTLSAFSQRAKKPNPYHFGIGAGYYPNLKEPYLGDIKFFTRSGNAIEFLIYNLTESVRVAGFFLPSVPINRDGTLRFLIGPGIHMGVWKDKYKPSKETNPIVGIGGLLGVEYKIPKVPLSFQIQYQPSVDFVGNNEYFYDNKRAGATVKLAF